MSKKKHDSRESATVDDKESGHGRRTVLRLVGALAGAGVSVGAGAGLGDASAGDEGDDDGDESTIETVRCGESIRGELTDDDARGVRGPDFRFDAYAFEATAGETVTISMSASEDGDPFLYLFGADGSIVGTDDDSGGGESGLDARVGPVSVPESGSYLVVATSFAPEQRFAYELRLDCASEIEAESIECGDTVDGRLTEDDQTGFRDPGSFFDAYRFSVDEAETVRASLSVVDPEEVDKSDSENGDDGEGDDGEDLPGDPYLYLLDAEGTIVAENDDSGFSLNSFLARVLSAGEYTLVATSFSPGETFDYRLTLDCAPFEAQRIECGDVVSHELTESDQTGFRGPDIPFDAYRFEGTEGEFVDVRMTSSGNDPYLYLLDADGTVVAADDDSGGGESGLDARIVQRLSASGEYVVIATSFDGGTFPYELSLTCSIEDPTIGPVKDIECGARLTGELTEEDATGFRGPGVFQDAYRFSAEAGERVTVSMASTEGDSFLYLLDADGTVVAVDDDDGGGFDALIDRVELEASGEYTIIATSFSPGETFEYDLSLQCDRVRYYQVDFVAGRPERRLGQSEDDFYSDQGRLIRYLHGNTADSSTSGGRVPTLDREIADCVDSGFISVDGDEATVEFTVVDGCELRLSLVSYTKPGPEWSRDIADQQRLVDSTSRRFGPGTYSLTVRVPSAFPVR